MPRVELQVRQVIMLIALVLIYQNEPGPIELPLGSGVAEPVVLLVALVYLIFSVGGPATYSHAPGDNHATQQQASAPNSPGQMAMGRGQPHGDDDLPYPIPEVGDGPPVRVHRDSTTASPPRVVADEHRSSNYIQANRPGTDPEESDLPYPIPESGDEPPQGADSNPMEAETAAVSTIEHGHRTPQCRRLRGASRGSHGLSQIPTTTRGCTALSLAFILVGIVLLLSALSLFFVVAENGSVQQNQPRQHFNLAALRQHRAPSQVLDIIPPRVPTDIEQVPRDQCDNVRYPIQETGDSDLIRLNQNYPRGRDQQNQPRHDSNQTTLRQHQAPFQVLDITPPRRPGDRQQVPQERCDNAPYPIQESGEADLVRLNRLNRSSRGSSSELQRHGGGLVDGGGAFGPDTSRHPSPETWNENPPQLDQDYVGEDQWALFTAVLVLAVVLAVLISLLFAMTTDDPMDP